MPKLFSIPPRERTRAPLEKRGEGRLGGDATRRARGDGFAHRPSSRPRPSREKFALNASTI